MNLKNIKSMLKQQIKAAEDNILIAQQNIEIATRLKSEAESRLLEIGASTRRAPRGGLTDEERRDIRARILS